MKIAFAGLDLPAGKIRHDDPSLLGLADKFQPKKVSPYYFEFAADSFTESDGIAVSEDAVLDVLIPDMELIEARLSNAEDDTERAALGQCLAHLEEQRPLCDITLEPQHQPIINALDLLSWKPTVVYTDSTVDPTRVCTEVMAKAGVMFFYTAGKQEVHAWFVEKGAEALTCAAKIHSDLARGFIKAEIVTVADLMTAHSMQDARSKGLTTLVDRDYAIEEETVIEIRFNV
jgi:hypothetical protein